MATVAGEAGTSSTGSGTKNATIAGATAGDLIIVVTAHTGNTSDATPTDDNTDGLGAYTQVLNALKASSADKMGVYVRNALVGNTVSTIVSHAPGTTTGGGIRTFRITGMSKAGATAILSSGKQENQAAATPAPVLSATPQSANLIIAAVFNATNPAGQTHRTGYTESQDTGYNSPATGFEQCYLNSGETSATLTFGGASPSAFCSMGVELDTSAPSGNNYNYRMNQ